MVAASYSTTKGAQDVQRYIIRRLLLAIPVIWLVVTLVFFVSHVRPTRAEQLAATCALSKEVCARNTATIAHQLGTDKPLAEQYVLFLGHLVIGDFGKSLVTTRPVLSELKDRSGPSIELGLLQIILSAIIALPVGVIAAINQDKWPDYSLRFLSIGLLAIPTFFLAPLLLLFSENLLSWTPSLNQNAYRSLLQDPAKNLQIMAIPVLAGAFATSASIMRLLRSQMLEVTRQDFVRTATAKGLRQSVVVVRHTLKNAMIPVLTIIGLLTAGLIGGNVILEQIFNIPGIGLFLITELKLNDLPVVLGAVICIAVIIVLTNLLVDVAYAWFDPRIRYS
ncbi:MAG: ABC transporter permease [Dehalococcoidia bacterium]